MSANKITSIAGFFALGLASINFSRAEFPKQEIVSKDNSQNIQTSEEGGAQAKRLLDTALSPEEFISIVEGSGGEGKVMETLSLLAASPPLLEGRFSQVLAAVGLFPNSEAARYLASNRYLSPDQLEELGRVALAEADSELAGNLAINLSLPSGVIDQLVEAGLKNPQSKLAKGIVASPALSEKMQNVIVDKVLRDPRGELADAFAGNPQLLPGVKDKIGAAVIDAPDTAMAMSFGKNPGLSGPQLDALVAVAAAFPDSRLAEGLGRNKSLQDPQYQVLMKAIEENPESELSRAVASNPNITDAVFAGLFAIVAKNPDSVLGVDLARSGGGGSTPARIANLANQAISTPNVKYARVLTSNATVPPEFFDAMIRAAIAQPRSELCRGFMEDVREKKFRGSHSQKMKIIEVSLTHGG